MGAVSAARADLAGADPQFFNGTERLLSDLLDSWDDLQRRIEKADAELREKVNTASAEEMVRLQHKAEGVRLALSYMREYG